MKIIILLLLNLSLLSLNAKELWTEIEIPVRDGKLLKADLYSTDTTIAKPCILIQTPYNKQYYRISQFLPPESASVNALFDTVNYNYVIMDWRGFYSNKEASIPQKDRGEDGYDAVEWIASQKWSNGKIGTSGSSALGMIQFQTARLHPPHLVCCAPFVKDFKTKYGDYYYGGDLRKEHTESLQFLGFLTVDLITSRPIYNKVWEVIEKQAEYAPDIEVPMLLVSGWFDHYPSDVIRAFEDLKFYSSSEVKDKHKLIMGPWTHSGLGLKKQGELEFTEAVDIPQNATRDFFDFYLRNIQNDWEHTPPVRYFEMGSNIWKQNYDWYNLSQLPKDTLYLYNDQTLSYVPPPPTMSPLAQLPDTIIYDPRDPSPTIGGSRFDPTDKNIPIGPYDISQTVETRNDILSYTTAVLNNDINISGVTTIELFISSNRKDTDFSVRLCDVYPDGKSYILTQGIKRARFYKSLSEENFLEEGIIYHVTIELSDLSVVFKKGHRMRIDITSSNYPMFDLNPNTGDTLYTPGDTLIATNLIYCNAEYPSKIIFPTFSPTSVDDSGNKANQINIFPNPANDYINIALNSSGIENEVKIVNSLGMTLYNSAAKYSQNVDISEFPVGVYFVIVNNGNQIFKEKFIKIE